MGRFYEVMICPKNGNCPLSDINEEPDCNSCQHCSYIGTLGGEYYIDCDLTD